jgi:hypothetical protein
MTGAGAGDRSSTSHHWSYIICHFSFVICTKYELLIFLMSDCAPRESTIRDKGVNDK